MAHADYFVRIKYEHAHLSDRSSRYLVDLAKELLLLTSGKQHLVSRYPIKNGVNDYGLDVYDFNGSAVMVGEDRIKIISSDATTLDKTKADLEDKLAQFRLEEAQQK